MRGDERVPQEHPLSEICRLTNSVLVLLSDEFYLLYSASGRASIAPEYVLREFSVAARLKDNSQYDQGS